jgi:exonuclease SbcD
MSIKILATADIHIGRRPTRLANPDDAHRFSAAHMWEAMVERAIEEKVDLVALAGDIVDHDNRFFEATGPLERGLTTLGSHGIPTFAVAGNHDFVGADCFRLLGRGGRWEETMFTADDGQELCLHGWSFPSSRVPTSPLAGYHLAPTDVPTVGILHADLDVPDSFYAPVTRAELNSTSVTLWLLGHIHKPDYSETVGGPPVLYPGSPQSLDPGEGGPHGPWLIEVLGPHHVAVRQLDMSRVRYEVLEVDLTGIARQTDFEAHVSQRVREYLDSIVETSQRLEYLSLRLNLTGRTKTFAQIPAWLGPLAEQFERTAGSVTARIDKVFNNTRPDVNLDELAEKHDLPGALAQLLLQLQAGHLNEDSQTLMLDAREKMLAVHSAAPYTRIDRDVAPSEDVTRKTLIRQGMLLLETLRAQEAQ